MKIRISSLSNAETNSLGKPVHHTAEGVANFWRWFKNSKVVDAQKRPLVVYHGTPSDFDTFDSSFHGQSDPGYLGEGFYFGTKAAGSTYSTRENGRVMPVYLSLQNPYIIHDGNWQATDHGYSRVAELCKLFEAKGEPYATARKSAARTYTEELKKQGFEYLRIPNVDSIYVVGRASRIGCRCPQAAEQCFIGGDCPRKFPQFRPEKVQAVL